SFFRPIYFEAVYRDLAVMWTWRELHYHKQLLDFYTIPRRERNYNALFGAGAAQGTARLSRGLYLKSSLSVTQKWIFGSTAIRAKLCSADSFARVLRAFSRRHSAP